MGLINLNEISTIKLLRIIFIFQLAVWISIGLNAFDPRFLIIRQFICFIYLIFIPGILIIILLKLNNLESTETILYTIGLSAATLIWLGFFINILYPIIGINRPISIMPLAISITLLVSFLCILCYIREKRNLEQNYVEIFRRQYLFNKSFLFLCLIPLLSIGGSYLMNAYQINSLIEIYIIVVALLVLLTGFGRFIPKKLYPLTVFVISISLLYHRSLISMYLWGWDVHSEFYFSNLVVTNSYWNTTIFYDVNSVPSITLLAPIYSIILNMNMIWVYKLIIPFLFSFVPVGLFHSYRRLFGSRIGILSIIFFMSIFSFYTELPVLLRQEIAELFLALLITLTINRKISKLGRSILIIIFSLSLIVSHYGLGFIYLFMMISSMGIFYLINNINYKGEKKKPSYIFINKNHILLYAIFIIAWYMYISDSYVFDLIFNIFHNMFSSVVSDFSNPKSTEGLSVLKAGTSSTLYQILKYFYLFTFFCISIGLIKMIITKRRNFDTEYLAFSIASFGINMSSIILPFFASSITTTRLYHISLFYLSPFFVFGGIFLYKSVLGFKEHERTNKMVRSSYAAISIFLFIFLLFNTGFIHEITHDNNPISISLNSSYDYPRYIEEEVFGAKWLGEKTSNYDLFLADPFGGPLLYEYIFPRWRVYTFMDDTENNITKGKYIYFRNLNVNGLILSFSKTPSVERPFSILDMKYSLFFNKVLKYKNVIYINGGSEIWI